MELHAGFRYRQCRLEKAKSEALRAADIYEKVGATERMEACRVILRNIEEKTKKPVTSGESDFRGKFLPETVPVL